MTYYSESSTHAETVKCQEQTHQRHYQVKRQNSSRMIVFNLLRTDSWYHLGEYALLFPVAMMVPMVAAWTTMTTTSTIVHVIATTTTTLATFAIAKIPSTLQPRLFSVSTRQDQPDLWRKHPCHPAASRF